MQIPTYTIEIKKQHYYSALEEDHTPIVKILLEAGADPNIIDQYNYTILMSAAFIHGNVEIIELLLAYGADPDYTNRSGYTAWNVADLNNHIKAAQLIKDWMISSQ